MTEPDSDDESTEYVAAYVRVDVSVGMDGSRGISLSTSADLPWWEQLGMVDAAREYLKHEAGELWAAGTDSDD